MEEFSQERAIYLQIADYGAQRVLDGDWAEGVRVPSARELSVQMAVNRLTVMRAYEHLTAAGVLEPRRGAGYYVSADAREKVRQARREEFFARRLPEVFAEMRRLGVTIQDVAARWVGEQPSW